MSKTPLDAVLREISAVKKTLASTLRSPRIVTVQDVNGDGTVNLLQQAIADDGTTTASPLNGIRAVGTLNEGDQALLFNAGSGCMYAFPMSTGVDDGGGTGTAGPSDAIVEDIVQAAHGLAVGNIVRLSGSSYIKAQADTVANAEVVGIVSAVADANNFTLMMSGHVVGLAGLTAGQAYFLSAATAGALTATEPSTSGQVSKPLLIADTTASGYFFNFRGMVVGGGAGSGLTKVVVAPPNKVLFTGLAPSGSYSWTSLDIGCARMLVNRFTVVASAVTQFGIQVYGGPGGTLEQMFTSVGFPTSSTSISWPWWYEDQNSDTKMYIGIRNMDVVPSDFTVTLLRGDMLG